MNASKFTTDKLRELEETCDHHLNSINIELKKINWLYRNQSENYFESIQSGNGIMEPRLKDKALGGHRQGSINDYVKGIWFAATLDEDDNDDPNNLPLDSPFFPHRITIPVERLIDRYNNLYFAEFYCITPTTKHCITLVVAEPGSEEDKYCKNHLVALDIKHNRYLKIVGRRTVKVCHHDDLFVELFYTERINIRREMKLHGAKMTLTKNQKLQKKCDEHVLNDSRMSKVNWVYRNKSDEYFQRILDGNGVMKPILKDNAGDPNCPINEKVKGIWLSATLYPWDSDNPEALPSNSPFGNTRIQIPVERMIDKFKHLYFSDFYCLKKNGYHYISLVLTEPDSESDKFCSKNLLQLDIEDNKYVMIDKVTADVKVHHGDKVWVELFYTERINIKREINNHGAKIIKNIREVSVNYNDPKKTSDCKVCNI